MGKQLTHTEWIGKQCEITDAPNKQIIGLKGTIVDETKNTITIETTKGNKKVPKKGITFKIEG